MSGETTISVSAHNLKPVHFFVKEDETLFSVAKIIAAVTNEKYPIKNLRVCAKDAQGRDIHWTIDRNVIRFTCHKTPGQAGEVQEFDVSENDTSIKLSTVLLKMDPDHVSMYSRYSTLSLVWHFPKSGAAPIREENKKG